MNLSQWAIKHHVSVTALLELQQISLSVTPIVDPINTREQMVSHEVRIKASEAGWRLWRNNVGATKTEDGSFIRYGLCNETAEINKQIKSADLIGIKPVVITEEMVGTTIGQFVSREVKRRNWSYKGTSAEQAQLAWATLVNSMGGDAKLTNGELE